MKRIRVALTALLVGGFMLLSPSSAFAESVMTTITCATPDGVQQEFEVGWDNSNEFFDGRGEIPRLYCEGGYAGSYTVYVSDLLALDDPLRWYNGIAPEPIESVEPEPTLEPSPEPVPSVEPEPVPSVEPSLNPEPTPTPEPTQSESPSIEPTPEPTPSPEPVVIPVPEPTPTPEPSVPDVEPAPVIEPTPTPSESVEELVQVLPEPTPSQIVAPDLPDLLPAPEPVNDEVVTLEVPSALASVPGIVALFEAAEAFMNIGSDMTDEQRQESQSVVVAAVIVTQLAMRKSK